MLLTFIYKLEWVDQGIVYIGRSTNPNNRISVHLDALKNNTHYNYRMQETYNKLGAFTKVEILETVSSDIGNETEISYINKYNSPLNLIGLYNTIEPSNIINHIEVGKPIPSKYVIVDPSNKVHYIDKMIDFVKSTPDLASLGSTASRRLLEVCRGKIGSYKGYRKYDSNNTLPNNMRHKYEYTIFNDTHTYSCTDLVEFCKNTEPFKDTWYSSADRLRAVARGVAKTHKKYRCTRKLINR